MTTAKRGSRRHPAFRPAYDASGPVPVIYGCGNCLITRSVFATLGEPAFDLRFNFLGGGDIDFFARCRRSRNEIPLGRRRRHHRDRAAQPDQSGMARAARLADRRRSTITSSSRRRGRRGRAPSCWPRLLARLPLSLLRAVRLVVTEQQGRHCPASDGGRARQRAGGRSASNRNPTKPRRSCLEPVRSPRRKSAPSSGNCGASR